MAAFTATTANTGNQIASGAVTIAQHPGSTALYAASDQKPGQSASGCVRVTYSGSLAAAVRLYVSAGVANGSLYNLKVERGSGLTSPDASMSCAGFSATSTAYDGDLGAFPSSWPAGRPGKAAGGPWAQSDATDYRFTITHKDDTTPNAHTTVTASGSHIFTWEARNLDDYENEVLATPGLLSYWRLGEAAGTTAYDSTGSAHASYENGPALGSTGLITSDADTAVTLDATDDRVNAGDVYDFAGTAPFSVEGWIKPTAANEGAWRRVISKEDTAGGRQGWMFLIHASASSAAGKLTFERWRDGSSDGVITSTVFAAGVRHHVVATYTGTAMHIYVDGVLESSNPGANTALPDTSSPLLLGTHPIWSADRFAGDLDDFSIYDRALSAAEVSAHYQRGTSS